jgi:phosphatidylserine/phosphatidylglycerophosphate/cardiolipin synthase-like enzyme
MLKKLLDLVFGRSNKTRKTSQTRISPPQNEKGEKPISDVTQAYFSPGDDCLDAVISALQKATNTLDICVFTISDDRISKEILACFRRGVKVRIITDNEKMLDLGSDIAEFKVAGIPLKIDTSTAHMHHKFAIIDRSRLLNGSYNWTRSAALHNQENLVVSSEHALVESFQQEFNRLWKNMG